MEAVGTGAVASGWVGEEPARPEHNPQKDDLYCQWVACLFEHMGLQELSAKTGLSTTTLRRVLKNPRSGARRHSQAEEWAYTRRWRLESEQPMEGEDRRCVSCGVILDPLAKGRKCRFCSSSGSSIIGESEWQATQAVDRGWLARNTRPIRRR